MSSLVQQDVLLRLVMPIMAGSGTYWKKTGTVSARLAIEGESIQTYTSDGLETQASAKKDQILVQNATDSQEHYLVNREKFEVRYEVDQPVSSQWHEYSAKGEIIGLEVTQPILDLLSQSSPFEINAPWDAPQVVKLGDMLVTPLPNSVEIYRIAKSEFNQTYHPNNKTK